MSSLESRLQARHAEHEALLQRVLAVLQADQRVVAAWLFGSRGRGTNDVLSDLDLWVVVKDEAIEEVCAERRAYVARVGKSVLLLESEYNAPKGGAYLMALYPGEEGVQQIDWYWQRQSNASLPRQAVALFNQDGISQDTRLEQLDPPGNAEPASRDALAEQLTPLNRFFWVMANIAVKSMVRHQAWGAINHLEGLREMLEDTRRLLGLSTVPAGQEAWRTTLQPPVQPLEQLTMLREITTAMEELTPTIEQAGGQVETQAIPYIYVDFELAEGLIKQKKGFVPQSHVIMSGEAVVELMRLCEQNGIEVFVEGGWGVDALLGRQTRPHADLDIALQHKDVPKLRALLEARGYKDVPRDDTRDCNFVMGDDRGHEVDFHSYTFDAHGKLVFGLEYPLASLTGTGSIQGYSVKCISPEWMVKFHSGYELDEDDYHDVLALCEQFGIALPAEYERFT